MKSGAFVLKTEELEVVAEQLSVILMLGDAGTVLAVAVVVAGELVH